MNLDRRLRFAAYVLALIGFLDSFYLLIIKLTNNKGLCLEGVGDCWTVNLSVYSEIAGVPIAVLGMGAYLTILALLFFETKGAFWKNNSPIIIFGIALAGTIYSAYLTYIEIYVIQAICPFCVISAMMILGLLGVSIARLVNGNQEEE
jgi:uncharacterized membrane protein